MKSKGRSLSAQEIHEKYYPTVSDCDFNAIVATDTLTSNFQRGKVGMYAKWLLRLLIKGTFSMEDLEIAMQYINVFDRLSKANMLENKDINQFKTLDEMYIVVQPYLETQIISKSEYTRQMKESQADKMYEDEQFLVVYPKSKWAASTYGRHTKWCTATSKYPTNYFENYDTKGKLYIIIDKKTEKKFQFHFDSNTYCDSDDNRVELNSLDSIKKLKPTKGLIDFFIEERKNSYLWEKTLDKLTVGENVNDKGNDIIYIGIHKKRYGIIHGNKGWHFLVPFNFDLIKKQAIVPSFYETYLNGDTDLCYFVDNELFYYVLWYSTSKKKFIEYNMYRTENLLFPYYIPSCKSDLNRIFQRLEHDFDKKFNKSFTHNKKRKNAKRRYIPNCIAANKLTMAILEYAYYDQSKDKKDEEIIRICRDRVKEFNNISISKIISQLVVNDINLFLIIENELGNGIFRLQYAAFLDLGVKK